MIQRTGAFYKADCEWSTARLNQSLIMTYNQYYRTPKSVWSIFIAFDFLSCGHQCLFYL